MCFMSSGLHIIYKKDGEPGNLHFDSKVTLLKVILWAECENNNGKLAPMVLEKAYFSKKNQWHYTNFGPYILEPDTYYTMLEKEGFLLFFINDDASIPDFFEIANECMRSAGWDNALLIPEDFYRDKV